MHPATYARFRAGIQVWASPKHSELEPHHLLAGTDGKSALKHGSIAKNLAKAVCRSVGISPVMGFAQKVDFLNSTLRVLQMSRMFIALPDS
jgi:hypothetical protein